MAATSKARGARWRERNRRDAVVVTVDVLPAHRRALEAMGMSRVGYWMAAPRGR